MRLSSYGGVDIQIRDSFGNLYNLAPGKTATIRIPVDPAAQRAKDPPHTVELWYYDQQTGLWRQQEGSAQLAGHFYEATVNHFSAIAVGVATTERRLYEAARSSRRREFPFSVKNHHSNPPTGADTTFTGTVSGPTDVIAELPPNEPITLEILDSAAQPIELTRQVVNSGAAVPGPANPNPPPGTCNSDAYLAKAPTDALGFDPNNLLFSPGGFLNYYGLDDQVSADAYYAAIDPTAVNGTWRYRAAGIFVID